VGAGEEEKEKEGKPFSKTFKGQLVAEKKKPQRENILLNMSRI